MALLPHIVIMHEIKNGLTNLRNNPDHIQFSLGGYCVTKDLIEIYGARFVDQAIKWVMETEITFALGYRLDEEKVPSIAVMFEGGEEKDQFLGDFGRMQREEIPPVTYATNMIFKTVNSDGNLVASKSSKLEDKIWRQLVLRKGEITRIIKDLRPTAEGDLELALDKPLTLADGLAGWSLVSSVSSKNRVIGSSLDNVRVKVYLDVSGDPELAEMVSCIIRYILKQSRLKLMAYGLNTPTFSYSSIMRNEAHPGTNVWSVEFTVTGKLTDEWILLESKNPDKILLNLKYDQSEDTELDDVNIQEIV